MIERNSSGVLCVDSIPLPEIARDFGTPVYVYSAAHIEDAAGRYLRATAQLRNKNTLICASVKANSNLSLLRLLAMQGLGFDVVSGGELRRVIAAGGDPRKSVFAGVGKTEDEIAFALDSGILMFNVESLAELARLNEIAGKRSVVARVSLRINPDVDANTHHHISTGKDEHKFGVPLQEALKAYRSFETYPHLEFVGIDCHIGSMIRDLSTFREAFSRVRTIVEELQTLLPSFSVVDLGGGLGVSYDGSPSPSVDDYISIVDEVFGDLNCTIILEPGRSIFGPAGVLLTEVLYTKSSLQKDFVVYDAGFNDLIRPLLYEAYHEFEPVQLDASRGSVAADLVGPICETGDCFAKGRHIQRAVQGDLYAVRTVGAYGFTMASNYNTRPRPAEVLVRNGKVIEIRPREKIEDLFQSELPSLSQIG